MNYRPKTVSGRVALDSAAWRPKWASWLELRAICRLEREVFLDPISLSAASRYWLSPKSGYLVVHDQGNLAAYLGLEVQGASAHILANVTDPRYRQRGLARFLLNAGAGEVRKLGARWLMGEVRASNHIQMHALEHVGFVAAGVVPRFFSNGEDAILYWWMLDPL